MGLKEFFMGSDVKTRKKKIDAAEEEAVKGKKLPPKPPAKPPAKKKPR
jgi:hypothetical protein